MIKNARDVLIIDCQVFQTAAWHRGMGKYSLNLLNAMFSNGNEKNYKQVVFMLNKNLELEPEAVVALESVYRSAVFEYLDLTVVKNKKIADVQPINKAIIQRYIENKFSTRTIDFLILSLFLGEATCIVFPDNSKKILLFYDLIPFLYAERYSHRIPYDDYLANFKTIFEADLLLAISQTVADDLTIYLGIPKDKIRSIDGAPIDRSKLRAVDPGLSLGDKFILMPSGDEIRKNNARAVAGFRQFNSINENQYKLVMTSFFSPNTIDELNAASENLVFTGNISESQLQWLYEKADLVLFASEYEGLGLPVLEAMTAGKKVACSDIPVFREISEDALYFFDHLDPASIAAGISHAIHDEMYFKKIERYDDVLRKYTWKESAKKTYNALPSLGIPNKNVKNPKPKIAIFTPRPDGFSAIGKVVAESHAALSELFEIDYYLDYGLYHREVRPDFLSFIANCYPATEFNVKEYAKYDAVVYHIGNSDYHLETIKNALYLPGYAIFHDTHLEGAYERLAIDGYMSADRIKVEEFLNAELNDTQSSFLASIADNQLGILTHSDYAKSSLDKVLKLGDKSILNKQLNLPVGTPKRILPKGKAEKLKICFAGIFADVKGLSVIEQVALNYDNECEITIFGYNFAQPESIDRLKKYANVTIIANPTDFEFQTLLMKQDVLVNFRLKYKGETSLTTLEAMRFGLVSIVRDIGWYGEINDEALIKVDEIEDVIVAIGELIINREKISLISSAALKIINSQFSHQDYAELLEKTISGSITDLTNSAKVKMLKALKTPKQIIENSNIII